MKTLEGRLWVLLRVVITAFIIIHLSSISRNIGDQTTSLYLTAFIGIALAIFITFNYGKKKYWARIWMLILNYISLVIFIMEVIDILKYSDNPFLSDWIVPWLIMEVIFIITTLFILRRVHSTNPADFIRAPAPTPAPVENPETKLEKLNNLLQKGLITQEDYKKKKEEILQKL